MNTHAKFKRGCRTAFTVIVICCGTTLPVQLLAQPDNMEGKINEPTLNDMDAGNDFDFEIGEWETKLRRLAAPLTGSTEWIEYEGTTVVTKVLDGKANLVELNVASPSGRIEGVSLRLYNPKSKQWSLNFANVGSGLLAVPTIGSFKNGIGEFYSHETYGDRFILVRFTISKITPTSCSFEQAYSDDGGRTWEVNWIAIDTRIK